MPIYANAKANAKSSLLLLMDSSGSMGDIVGNGNNEVKIDAAKEAAVAAVQGATANGLVEVAILAFEGECSNPIPRYVDFTTDTQMLENFISTLQPGGGTPMAEAVLLANQFMKDNGKPKALTQMIVLLADGQNDCGDVQQAMKTLQSGGVVFRHETVGFGIEPNSQAADDLRFIATSTGGVYHHAQNATQLADVFMEFVDTLTVIDMLGQFKHLPLGGAKQNSPASGNTNKPAKKPSVSSDLLDAILLN